MQNSRASRGSKSASEKIADFESNSQAFEVVTLHMSQKTMGFHWRLPAGATLIDCSPFWIRNHLMTTPQTPKMQVRALLEGIYYICVSG